MAEATVDDNPKERPRACAYCNKSKTKCIWIGEPGDGSCQRCARLNRDCILPQQGEKRRRGPSTRVGQLEEKIDGIMSLLNAGRQLQQTSASSQSQPSPTPQTPPIFHDPIRDSLVPPSPKENSSYVHTTPPLEYIDIVPTLRVSFAEADRLLTLYRTDYSPRFPFVPITDDLRAYDLFQNRPFLFRTIMHIVAPQNAAVQRDVNQWFRQYIAEHIVINQEKRLELLQALILFIAWGEFHFYLESAATNLWQLAVGLVLELGLNKPPKVPSHLPNHMVEEARRAKGLRMRAPHTLEDMRTYLGCYYITSLAAVFFRHLPMFPYSNYINTCCAAVVSQQEYQSDKFMAALIQLQRIACRIHAAFPSPDIDVNGPSELSAPSFMVISSIRAELESLKRETPKEIQNHWAFDVCYRGLLVRLYEPAIYIRPSSASNNFAEGTRRSEVLWSCLDAAKIFFEAYCTIPLHELPYLSFSTFSHFSFTLVTATRLLFLNDSDWNRQLAFRTFDFPRLTQHLAASYDQADRLAAAGEWRQKRKYIDDARSVMALHRDKLTWMSSWCVSQLGSTEEPQDQQIPDVDIGEFSAVQILSPSNFDGEWWQDVLEDFSFGQPKESAAPSLAT
ncbi:hypothetical protein B0T17DRAFT_86157 [Bombardia bombarda]|uniref:Zn(2)-C6 fungal-type domain-containing protein n=1 Tax=Bombardia bombarda TaxID=252184 RepID=A0AA39XM84_9PEZI|nr:hypothetical protein B0T17DRAFT_86157 [Bombardia bombarda]